MMVGMKMPRHRRDGDGGIYAARKERPQRHVADHADLGGLEEFLAQTFAGVVEGKIVLLRRVNPPVAPDLADLAVLDDHGVRRRQLAHRLETGHGGRNILEGEIVIECPVIRAAVERRVEDEQRADLGGEQESLGRRGVDQRLHAQAVAREGERALVPVPDGGGEHPAQLSQALLETVADEKLEQHLGVAVAAELLAERLEALAQVRKIVELAVEDKHVAAVVARHRLAPGPGQINDGQARVAQTGGFAFPGPLLVRAAQAQEADRLVQTEVAPAAGAITYDAAHWVTPVFNTCSSFRAFAAQVNSASARARAATPMRRSASRSVSRSAIAGRQGATSPPRRTPPGAPSLTISTRPPLREASTGSSQAMASTTLMPKDSSPMDGCTNRSACRRIRGNSPCLTPPMKCTRPAIPSLCANPSSTDLSGPSPTRV